MRLSICGSSRAAALAERLALRLERNLGVETLMVQEDAAPVCETWEEGAAADAVLVLLDGLSAPLPLRREAWKGLIDHDGDPPLAFARLEDCAYPKLLERGRFFFPAEQTRMERSVERWVTGLLPARTGISTAAINAEIPEDWWPELVDLPSSIVTPDAATAQAFAHQAAAHFQGVVWIGCAGREPALIRAEVAYRAAEGRMLVVLAHIGKPLSKPDDRHSYVQVQGPLPASDGDAALGACYSPVFPGWLALELGGDLSQAVLLDTDSGLYRLPTAPGSNDEMRTRHLEAVHRYFQSWKQKPERCQMLLSEVPAALDYGFARHWTLSTELCRRAAFLLLAEGRRREAIRMFHRLLLEAEEHGDTEVAAETRHELSWLTDDDEPLRVPVRGQQLAFDLK